MLVAPFDLPRFLVLASQPEDSLANSFFFSQRCNEYGEIETRQIGKLWFSILLERFPNRRWDQLDSMNKRDRS